MNKGAAILSPCLLDEKNEAKISFSTQKEAGTRRARRTQLLTDFARILGYDWAT